MTVETQEIEYKDFSKSRSLEKKAFVSKLFKEITAFANSKGGKIIVGKEDKTGDLNAQPKEVIEWLDNDIFTSAINRISDNLVIFKCEEKEGFITITVQESDDVISASVDYKGINKGDCFLRENHQANLAKGNSLKKLIERKTISIDSRLNELRKIVHHKFVIGENTASLLNIFDSLVVGLESNDEHISTVFDNLVKQQFICSYNLPLSKYTSMQMHLQTIDSIIKKIAN
ncbi:ATP-binding protein [Zobellia roscoffensis]|uniref:AlbA family DNA-binding domain-containing protein n=1 Tax=Zobellia roscoffensis TaxID=2779508 RepID=UPI00188CF4AA|nr:ATP-binding protein [Zobellia roscoffensis]